MKALRKIFISLISACLISGSVLTNVYAIPDDRTERPGAVKMAADVLIARPLLFVATAVGASLFIISLPFSLISGKTTQAAKALVVTPADATFNRCLGCTRMHGHHDDFY